LLKVVLSPFPYILGHETVAEVIDCGKKTRYLKPGDWILQSRIEDYPELGLGSAWGGFVEYAVATDWKAMQEDNMPLPNEFFVSQQKIPKDMNLVDAVMSITLKEVYSALLHFGVKLGDSVLIFGDGPVGISMVSCAKLMGANPIIICGHHNDRLNLAATMGATHIINTKENDLDLYISKLYPKGIDLVVDVIGDNTLIQKGLDLINDSGKVGIYGFSGNSEILLNWSKSPSRWTLDYLVVPKLDLLIQSHAPVIQAIHNGLLAPSEIVTDILPLSKVQKTFELTRSRKTLKAMIDMSLDDQNEGEKKDEA